MLGVEDKPTQVDNMIMPPQAYGVKVISIGMFTPGNTPVVWRGPMLHRALQQFLADVWWGDLDVLLMDLPPGTGDVAISVAQLVPNAEILVVTTPQLAAAEVAERAGAIASPDPPAGGRRRREHVVAGPARRLAHGGLRLRRRRGRLRRADPHPRRPRCRCSARSRWTPGCARPATPVRRSCWPSPTRPRPRRCAPIADGLAVRQRGLSGRSLGLTPVRH